MLTQAEDYKFVKTDDISRFINGDIMPIVFPTKGTKALVRFEDYLFLLEGFYERMNPELAEDNRVIPPVRTLYGTKILGSEFTTNYLGYVAGPTVGQSGERTSFVWPSSTIPKKTIYVLNSSTGINVLADYIENSLFQLSAKRNYAYYAPKPNVKSQLWANYMRARYYDLFNCQRLFIPLSLADFITQLSINTYRSDGSVVSTSEQDLNTRQSDVIFQTFSNGGTPFKRKDYTVTLKENLFVFPYAKSAKFIFLTYIESGFSATYNVCSHIDLTVTDGAVKCPSTLIDDMLSVTTEATGVTFYDTAKDVAFRTSYCYLLVDFDFPASLPANYQWDWQP